MDIKPDGLDAKGFILLDELDHNEIAPFIRKYLNKFSKTSILYYGLNLMLFVIPCIIFIMDIQKPSTIIFDWGYHYFIGFTIAFLLIPLHEYIHVLAYKSQGANNTSYDMNLSKFYFMALADNFVANSKEFMIVALAPFITISCILLLCLPFVSHDLVLTILGTLFAHTAMCSGDFGLVAYFEFHKNKKMVTYDDTKNKKSYFYALQFVQK